MTPEKLREQIKIRLVKMGLDKSGSRNEIANRIKRTPSAVSMALTGYRPNDIKTLNQINEALDHWNN